MLGAILHCTSDPEEEIRQKADKTNAAFLELVQSSQQALDINALLSKLTRQLSNRWEPTRLAALRWVCMLLQARSDTLVSLLDEVFPPLLRTLSDPSEAVVRLDLEALARIGSHDNQFEAVLGHLVRIFASDAKLLETRGSLIVRQLCVLLNGERIYQTLARLLQTHDVRAWAVWAVGCGLHAWLVSRLL
jgi:vacuole morphology and inheritance protein 14